MSLNEWPKKATSEEWSAYKLGREKERIATRVQSRNHTLLAEACRAISAHFPAHPAGKIAAKAIEACKPKPVDEWR